MRTVATVIVLFIVVNASTNANTSILDDIESTVFHDLATLQMWIAQLVKTGEIDLDIPFAGGNESISVFEWPFETPDIYVKYCLSMNDNQTIDNFRKEHANAAELFDKGCGTWLEALENAMFGSICTVLTSVPVIGQVMALGCDMIGSWIVGFRSVYAWALINGHDMRDPAVDSAAMQLIGGRDKWEVQAFLKSAYSFRLTMTTMAADSFKYIQHQIKTISGSQWSEFAVYAGNLKFTVKALTDAYGLQKHEVSAMVHSLFGSFGVNAEKGFLMRITYWMDYAMELLGCSLRSSAQWLGNALRNAQDAGWFEKVANVASVFTGILAFIVDWYSAISLIDCATFTFSKTQVATAMKLVHPLELPLPSLPVFLVADKAAGYGGDGFSGVCGVACAMLALGAIRLVSSKIRPSLASRPLLEPFMDA